MVLLFEDNENTPSSKLLKSSLYGENIKFSGSNTALARTAEKLRLAGHKVIIFVDLAVNNESTKLIYEDLSDKYEDDSDIMVLPIICIEYYILKMLYNHGFLNFSRFKNDSNIQNLLKNFVDDITGEKIDKSLEKQYKIILNEVIGGKKSCYINKAVKQKGKFYRCDCPCDNIYCSEYNASNVKYKAECLYSTLPVFFIDSQYTEHIKELNLELDIHSTTLKEVYNKLVKLHTKLNSLYGDGGAPIFRFNDKFTL